MSAVTGFMKKSGVQYLATLGADGRPKVRPFQFMFEEGGRLYFCTSNQKKVFAEMRRQPCVELCCMGEDSAWLRLSGRAEFVKDLDLKAKAQASSPLVKGIYKTPENPVFELFYLADAEATIADFSGAPPRTFKL